MRYSIVQVKNQKGWITLNLNNNSNIGDVIGIGKPNHRIYRYSVIRKYKNRINTEENVEIKIPGEALKIMEVSEVIDNDAPIVIIEYGITILILVFIL